MDVEIVPPPPESSPKDKQKKAEDSSTKDPPVVEPPKHPKLKSKRSRSNTPSAEQNKELQVQLKPCDVEPNQNGSNEADKPAENGGGGGGGGDENFKRVTRSQTGEESPMKKQPKKQQQENEGSNENGDENNVEIETVVIPDDPEPELQFNDSSDMDSAQSSPVVLRSATRRTLLPTPKTSKSLDFDSGNDSIDLTNISTQATTGSDVTREDLTPHDESYFQKLRERSLNETLRSLGARRPIRDDYRRLAMQVDGAARYSFPLTGRKRKERSATPEGEESKRFRGDGSPSFFASIRSRFSRVGESTPKLTGYKDSSNDIQFDQEGLENGVADKKNWCTVM